MDGNVEVEIWRAVPGYPRLEISNEGRLRALKRDGSGWFEPRVGTPPSARYPMVSVWNGEAYTTKRVHELVARAWHGEPPPGSLVRHIDHDPQNWRPDNLAYGTYAQNARECVAAGRHAHAKLKPEQVSEMRRTFKPEHGAIKELCKRFSVSRWTIRYALSGRSFKDVSPPKAERYRTALS